MNNQVNLSCFSPVVFILKYYKQKYKLFWHVLYKISRHMNLQQKEDFCTIINAFYLLTKDRLLSMAKSLRVNSVFPFLQLFSFIFLMQHNILSFIFEWMNQSEWPISASLMYLYIGHKVSK